MEQLELFPGLKELSDEQIRVIMYKLTNDKENVRMEVKDEKGNLKGFRKIYLKRDKTLMIVYLTNEINKLYKKLDGKLFVKNRSKIVKEIEELEDTLDYIMSIQTYDTFMDGTETYEYAIDDMKNDIASIARKRTYKLQ